MSIFNGEPVEGYFLVYSHTADGWHLQKGKGFNAVFIKTFYDLDGWNYPKAYHESQKLIPDLNK